jgi:NAD-dependent dihydropyrimidine dehydrogenase PreA subunit
LLGDRVSSIFNAFREHDAPGRLIPEGRGSRFMTYVITQPCIGLKDASCVEVCPVDCIYEGEDMYYIHPDECIECAACEPECPVEAIFAEEDVPPEWRHFIQVNADFFVNK